MHCVDSMKTKRVIHLRNRYSQAEAFLKNAVTKKARDFE